MRNSENILGSKSTTWIAKKEMISVKNITGSELAGGVKDHSSKLYQALLNATNGKLEITMMSFRPQERSIVFSALANSASLSILMDNK